MAVVCERACLCRAHTFACDKPGSTCQFPNPRSSVYTVKRVLLLVWSGMYTKVYSGHTNNFTIFQRSEVSHKKGDNIIYYHCDQFP